MFYFIIIIFLFNDFINGSSVSRYNARNSYEKLNFSVEFKKKKEIV